MSQFEGFPVIIGWELTLACNLYCTHCGSSAGNPRPHELSLSEALGICDQFPDLFVNEVDFTGGEPLLCNYFWNVVEHLHDLKIKSKVITNGLLLESGVVSQLKDAGIDRVGVSIDGLKATHDRIRRKDGLFDHIIMGLELLAKAKIPVTVITTVNARNIDQLPDLYSLLHALNVDIWQFQPLFPLGRAHHSLHLSLSSEQYLQMGKFYEDYRSLNVGYKPTITPGDSFGYFTDFDLRQPPWGGCSAGIDLCGITSDGHIKGCLSMPDEFTEGDLRERDLWDIWFDENSFAFNRKFSMEDLGINCSLCEHGSICRGGCTSMSYACTGKKHNDPYCFSRLGLSANSPVNELRRTHSEIKS